MVARPMPRPNTMARYELARERATAKGITVLAERNGWALVRASNGRDAYLTDGDVCGCKAWTEARDPLCVHRVAYVEWLLSRTAGGDDAPPAAPAVCGLCRGAGEIRKESATFAGVGYRVACVCTQPAA